MTTLFMKMDSDRSSAVDRVGFDTDGNVYVRFKKYGDWYMGKKDSTLRTFMLEHFDDTTMSFGTWANYAGLFDGLVKCDTQHVVG